MAPPAIGGGGGQVQQRAPPQGGFSQMIFGLLRMAAFWYIASQFFGGIKKSPNPALLSSNLYSKGDQLDMWLYISESATFSDFQNEDSLIWQEANVPYGEWGLDGVRHHRITYDPSKIVKQNSSVYVHVFFTHSGFSPNPNEPDFDKATFSKSHAIVVFYPRPKQDNRKSLLGGVKAEEEKVEVKETTETVDEIPPEWVPFWKPNVTINTVVDFTRYARNAVPPNLVDHIHFDEKTGNYFPVIYFNEFWLLRDKLVQVNETVKELSLDLELGPISSTKWQLFTQMEQSFQVHRNYGSMLDGEADELKRVFLEGNPYLLFITMAVSLLHTVFDMLAFKNDIQFWNQNKSMQGLSAKTVVVGFVCQLIIFFYLLDNETSWMIIMSSGVGCCIEFWKIGKAMHVQVDRSGRFPRLRIRDRESYANNKTKEYDDMAMRYLGYALFPLVGCFAIYSLMYERHRSWYSWVLSSLTGCVYTFGFIMMCPQLFINYKLKSVAHLPWRQMTYKFLNTIIDDLFAFVIKMPILHRLSVFRDDVIFLIYIYQRWIYPVDKSRINEFGFGGTEKNENEEDTSNGAVPALGGEAGEASEKQDGQGLVKTAAGRARDGGSQPSTSEGISSNDKKSK